MTWDADAPDDDVVLASAIHTHIQNAKEMIRERGEASDGTIYAHNQWSDDDNAGIHQASIVGFAKVHLTTAAMNAFTPVVAGSVHVVLTPRSLYVVDEDLNFQQVYPPTHAGLTGLTNDDHALYQTRTMSKAMTGDLTLVDLTITSGSSDDEAIPSSHASQDWETAHGAASLGNDHFEDQAIGAEHLVHEVVSGTGYYTVDANGRYSWPWIENATSAQAGEVFWYLRINYDNKVGFYHDVHGWLDDTVYMGKYDDS